MKRLLPLVFALVKFVSGYLLYNHVYELQRDEYLYLNQGQHLAWGYFEVPPLIAAQGWVSMALGGSFFWVKFWPFLWGAATVYLLVRLTQQLGGGWFAQVLTGLCYLGTAFARLNLLFQPNSFEVFGFVFCLYWLVSYFQQEKPRYLYLLGLGLGLSLLNKYTTLFFIAALGGALLLTPWRRLLLSRYFWGSAGLGLLIWLPNLIWQLSHGIPFLHHMALLHDTQLVHVEAADFWKKLLLMCLPALPVWAAGLLALLLGKAFRPYRAVGLVSVLGVGLLAVLQGKDYYALGYFPVLFVFGALWWETRIQRLKWLQHRGARALVQAALLAPPVLLTAALYPFIYPLLPPGEMAELAPRYRDLGLYQWEDGQQHALPQDYADMLGWQELADQTWAAYQSLPAAVRAHTIIHCANYGQASAINYYNRHRALPPAHSMNGSFLFWYPTQGPIDALIIVDDEPDDELAPHFGSYRRFGQLGNPYAREQGTAITLGLRPDSIVVRQIREELRQGRAAWEGAKK